MDKSFTKVSFLVVLLIVSKSILSQTTFPHSNTITTSSHDAGNKITARRIKWTWQLPAPVKKAFNESQYKDWFIENIIPCHQSGKTFFRFFLNNKSLLDGDHYDSFLINDHIDISDSGTIIRNRFPY